MKIIGEIKKYVVERGRIIWTRVDADYWVGRSIDVGVTYTYTHHDAEALEREFQKELAWITLAEYNKHD
jgi:hypothetical protein